MNDSHRPWISSRGPVTIVLLVNCGGSSKSSSGTEPGGRDIQPDRRTCEFRPDSDSDTPPPVALCAVTEPPCAARAPRQWPARVRYLRGSPNPQQFRNMIREDRNEPDPTAGQLHHSTIMPQLTDRRLLGSKSRRCSGSWAMRPGGIR